MRQLLIEALTDSHFAHRMDNMKFSLEVTLHAALLEWRHILPVAEAQAVRTFVSSHVRQWQQDLDSQILTRAMLRKTYSLLKRMSAGGYR